MEGQGASSGSTNTGKASAPVRGEEGSGRGAHIPLTRKHGHLHYIRILMRYVWPRGMLGIRFRVIVALFCLVASKVVTVVTPFGVKNIIDDLSVGEFPLQWILWMSFGKCISLGLTNLRDSVFVHVTVHAVREVGSETFSHLHTLSMLFHTKRKTGALLRAMDRGASGIKFCVDSCPPPLHLFRFFFTDWPVTPSTASSFPSFCLISFQPFSSWSLLLAF